MLVLSRREGESLYIGENITITVVECRNDKVRIGITAPLDVPIVRSELEPRETKTYKIPGVHTNSDNRENLSDLYCDD